ncbi:hypothetical protein [Spongiibacter pelagi]|nr:hypothetical protein [Spongiibacter pelagi]
MSDTTILVLAFGSAATALSIPFMFIIYQEAIASFLKKRLNKS